jgi:hypothetical protein
MGKHVAKNRNDNDKEVHYDIKYIGSIEVDCDFKEKAALELRFSKAIEDMVYDGRDEFIPPLSYRKGSAGSGSVKNPKDLRVAGLLDYKDKMLSQKNILAITGDGDVIAFASFRHDYEDRNYLPLAGRDDKINYLTTIIVNDAYRRNGIANKLYDYLENNLPEAVHGNIVATRTWWTEDNGHLKLLDGRGYILTCTLHCEREFMGEKYDTVYYCKRVERKQKNSRLTH